MHYFDSSFKKWKSSNNWPESDTGKKSTFMIVGLIFTFDVFRERQQIVKASSFMFLVSTDDFKSIIVLIFCMVMLHLFVCNL